MMPHLAGLAAMLLAATVAAEPLRLPPPPPPADPELGAFLADLQSALAAQAPDAVAALAAPGIKVGLGDLAGPEAAAGFLAGDWAEAARITRLPPRLDGRYAIWPHAAADWPDTLDPATHLVAWETARLRGAPDPAAPALQNLAWSVLPAQGQAHFSTGEEVAAPPGWIYLCLSRARCGYLALAETWSPLGLRLRAERLRQGWRLTGVTVGD